VAVLRRAAPGLALLCACGLGGGDGGGGGGDHLPASGAGPYGKITDFERATPADEPFVLADFGVDLLDPAPIAVGGGYRVFHTRRASGGAPEIWRADLPSLGEAPGDAAPVLVAEEAWEAGEVRAPSIVIDGPLLILYYQGGASSIGRATSADGGRTWRRSGMVLSDATQPAALLSRGVHRLYFTRPSRPGIFHASSTDGVTYTVDDAPVLEGRRADVFDVEVSEPAVAGGETAAGEQRIALYFTGTDLDGARAIGFAASRDGLSFTRAAEGILDPEAPDESGPGVVLETTRGVLFFTQARSGRPGIAAATSP
jgi:hypothetical protein